MKTYRVAVVGATGLVGRKMLEVLEERNFPIASLTPVASPNSAGSKLPFRGAEVAVKALSPSVFENIDFALFSAGASISKEWAPIASAKGAVVIDNSSAFRMDPEVPLVVPEVNPDAAFKHNGIIANPNCSTIQLVVALKPLYDRYGIARVVVSTYQGVTGSGKKGVDQLLAEIHNREVKTPAYPHPIAFNCLPHIDVFLDDGYTKEEHKMINETRKILGDASLKITATCVRVPVIGGHSESVNLQTHKAANVEDVRKLLQNAPGIIVADQPEANVYPMPITAHNRDEVFVGRIRKDPSAEKALNFWVVSDNLRKGAATNAVQIAELLIAKK
jgi:aspartate-semialdehyde dehydrogenase